MARSEIQPLLNRCDFLIREGRASEVALLLKDSIRATASEIWRWPASDRARIIQILRRAGLHEVAIRFGQPFVRGKFSEMQKPSKDESLEYAAVLAMHGLEDEAIGLLDQMQKPPPMALFYKALALFPKWEYRAAEIVLARFLEQTEPDDYFHLVGRLNQLACYVYLDRDDRAVELAEEILRETRKLNYHLIEANALELLAQYHLRQVDLSAAEATLNHASALARNSGELYQLFIEKWRYVLSIKKGRIDPAQYAAVASKARAIGHFESVRDLFLQQALQDENAERLRQVAVGTPLPRYRQEVGRRSGLEFADSDVKFLIDGPLHEWSMKPKSQSSSPLKFDVGGHQHERLLEILLSDFFSPWRLPRLWQKLFPGRWFDPKHSRNLLHQHVHALRRQLSEQNMPLKIHWQDQIIFVECVRPLEISRSISKNASTSLQDHRVQELKNSIAGAFGSEWFSRSQLEQISVLLPRTLQRHLSALVENRSLLAEKTGPTSRYRLK